MNFSAFFSEFIGIIGVVLGGIITWAVSKHFYIKASIDLEKQTKILIELNEVIAGFLESKGIRGLYFDRGKDGKLSGIIYSAADNPMESTGEVDTTITKQVK